MFTLVLTEPTQAQRVSHLCVFSHFLHTCGYSIVTLFLCVFVGAVLQRSNTSEQRWNERSSRKNQPNTDGEVPQTAGCSKNAGKFVHCTLKYTLIKTSTCNVIMNNLCVQLVWLVRELVKSGVIGADGVIMTLLKQIAGQTLVHHICCIKNKLYFNVMLLFAFYRRRHLHKEFMVG